MAEGTGAADKAAVGAGAEEAVESITLTLEITDSELVAELSAYPEGEAREEFALKALHIGVLAIKQAEGRIDAETIRNEGEHILQALGTALEAHEKSVSDGVANSLKEYFDPESGRFNERIERFIKKDGDLERFMKQHIGPERSTLAETLLAHLGENSPFMKLLSTEDSKGFLAALSKKVGDKLTEQREALLKEFTLDNDDSALSRLVRKVEGSSEAIVGQFSLDDEKSALSHMKRELLEVLKEHEKAAEEFRAGISEQLGAIAARRKAEQRSTLGGIAFEEEVRRFIFDDAQKIGDIPEDTSNSTGLISRSKVGDVVVKLNPDCAAGGARIVVEAKESAAYTLGKAKEELETARKNRGAAVGMFVFSKRTAPDGLDPMRRYGNDVVVVWDAEDPATDVFLEAGLSVARAICTKEAAATRASQVDFECAEKAIRAIEKLSKGLDIIKTSGQTIRNSSQTILERVDIMTRDLNRQVVLLDEEMRNFKSVLGSDESDAEGMPGA